MDYSQLSDAEIAQKVWFWWNENIEHDNTLFGMSGVKMLYVKNAVWTVFDPCNNPADAWPIIESNNISINHDAVVEEWIASHGGVIYQHCRGKRPLRLAMECFLKMQDANHA